MATAVKLYYTYSTALGVKWELIPSKLLVVEDIESYLATKTYKNITDFQYVKNELELSINVDLGQGYSQPRSETNFKYVSIQNAGEQIHYYFVKKATWRSKTCVRFDLVMDVLNTFQEGRDFNFKDNTRIVREHKPRFKGLCTLKYTFSGFNAEGSQPFTEGMEIWVGSSAGGSPAFHGTFISTGYDSLREEYYFIMSSETRITRTAFNALVQECIDDMAYVKFYHDSSTYVDAYAELMSDDPDWEMTRVIDIVNEGINPILQCGNAEGIKIEKDSPLNMDWFLLYRNQEEPSDSLVNPVECYLIPETDLEVDSGIITAGRLTATSLQLEYYYIIGLGNKGYDESFNVSITLDDGTVLSPTVSTNDQRNVIIKRINDNTMTITVIYGEITSGAGSNTRTEGTYNCKYITFSSLPVRLAYGITQPTGQSYNIRDDILSSSWLEGRLTLSNTTNPAYINGINDLDKTDSKNIKLIKLPYCPYNFSYTGDVLNISDDTNWDYVKLTQGVSPNDSIIYCIKLNDNNLKLTSNITQSDEQPLSKLIYPSATPALTDLRKGQEYESKLLHSDYYQPTYAYDSFSYKIQLEKINLDLYTSIDLTSLKIKFDMTSTINSKFMFTFDLKLKNATENYAKYMPIARNNEEVLYNVPYINYIRNGYQYDIKNKNISNISNAIGLGLSATATGVALAFAPAPLKIAGIVAGLVSVAMSIKNTIVSAQQNEDSIQRKLQETRNQASSVAGSDDVDLMSIYAENRLKYLVYEPTALMKSILFDLFFYAGYSSGRMGKPNHDTRVNFDYLECEASLENEGSIPDECLQELLNCFKAGVCYLHKTTRASEKWDFEQKYENWEKFLFN